MGRVDQELERSFRRFWRLVEELALDLWRDLFEPHHPKSIGGTVGTPQDNQESP